MVPGTEPNRDAAAKVEEFLEVQLNMNRNTTMDDVQKRYQAKPYGWREIDVAAVAAMLFFAFRTARGRSGEGGCGCGCEGCRKSCGRQKK